MEENNPSSMCMVDKISIEMSNEVNVDEVNDIIVQTSEDNLSEPTDCQEEEHFLVIGKENLFEQTSTFESEEEEKHFLVVGEENLFEQTSTIDSEEKKNGRG